MTRVPLKPGHPYLSGKRKKPESVTPPELWPEEYDMEYKALCNIFEHQMGLTGIEARRLAEIGARANAEIVDGVKL